MSCFGSSLKFLSPFSCVRLGLLEMNSCSGISDVLFQKQAIDLMELVRKVTEGRDRELTIL